MNRTPPDMLGWRIGPGPTHAHPDKTHGFVPNTNAYLVKHLGEEHAYFPYKTLPANRRLHRSLHADVRNPGVNYGWRQWRRHV